MRNLNCNVNKLREKVFCAVAKLGFEGGTARDVERMPYEIIPGEVGTNRESIFLERAIIGERIRLAIGLPLRNISEQNLISDGLEDTMVADKYYEPPLINVVKFACNGCKDTHYKVTSNCQHCLAKHCANVCPRNAISFKHGKAEINQDLCIKCGKCMQSCSFHAILHFERPCSEACGMNAIGRDQYGKAEIDHTKCVSCGMCLVNCPFGAIVDKSQLFQVVQALKRGDEVTAIIAPAFFGQFGDKVRASQLKAAMLKVGFTRLEEVAIGADLCAIMEANEFMREVPKERPFLATSCCPAWSVMAKKEFPDLAENISMSLTPMVLTARLMKKRFPNTRVVFIGPCAAKKLEASRRTIRSDVDFVLTFEELKGIFDAKGINFDEIPVGKSNFESSAAGIGFASSGGVAQAVVDVIKELDPAREVKTVYAENLSDCRKMLKIAKTGKYDGCLLEGMACPGGCVAGAGTIQDPAKAGSRLALYKSRAKIANPLDSEYLDDLISIIEERGSKMPEDFLEDPAVTMENKD